MKPPEIDLGRAPTGSVTAPAGHGKTEVIASSVAYHPEIRFLVLTHTNAGVASLRDRIRRYDPPKAPRVETLASLSLRIVRGFPRRIAWTEPGPRLDYSSAMVKAAEVLGRPTVLEAFAGSYDRVVVDEYQDCNTDQDALVRVLADRLPVVALGDPLQGIFSFDKASPMVKWDDVRAWLPDIGTLGTPHRWAATEPRLGRWLKEARDSLLAGQGPLRIDPSTMTRCSLARAPAQGSLSGLIRTGETTAVIIADSKKPQAIQAIAKTTSGPNLTVREAVEHRELMNAAAAIASALPPKKLVEAVEFISRAATKIKSVQGVRSVLNSVEGKGMVGRGKSQFAEAAGVFMEQPTPSNLEAALGTAIGASEGRVYRREQVSLFRKALRLCSDDAWLGLADVCRVLVDQASHTRHARPQTAEVGSTLRLKGLEYDHVILVDPADTPTREHLYVALSRATRRITLATSPGKSLAPWLAQ